MDDNVAEKIGSKESALIFLLIIVTVIFLLLSPEPEKAVCIDCAPNHIGGGCTFTDETGRTIQPESCVPYDTSKEKHACPEESKGAQACILLYQPVCGNDGRTYSNSCFACANPYVAFYLEGKCKEITK